MWYTAGLSVQFLPLQVPDPKQPCSYLPTYRSTVIKKSFEKAQKESRDFNSEDIEKLAKQTLLSSEDDEVWVTHLDSVKKRRQAGARKAAATRKQKSDRRTEVQ